MPISRRGSDFGTKAGNQWKLDFYVSDRVRGELKQFRKDYESVTGFLNRIVDEWLQAKKEPPRMEEDIYPIKDDPLRTGGAAGEPASRLPKEPQEPKSGRGIRRNR